MLETYIAPTAPALPFLAELGHLAVILALGAAIYAVVASALGAHRGVPELHLSGRRAHQAVAALTTLAALALVYSFLAHDFSIPYVWQTSSRTTPTFYLLTGIWGGQAGSLMFWAWLLAVSVAALRGVGAPTRALPWFMAITAAVASFFLFSGLRLRPVRAPGGLPLDGNGLNPLLQHPGMAFHPPTLYLGLTGMACRMPSPWRR